MRILTNTLEALFNPRIIAAILGAGLLISLTFFGLSAISAQAAVAPGAGSGVTEVVGEVDGSYLELGLSEEADAAEAAAIRRILDM